MYCTTINCGAVLMLLVVVGRDPVHANQRISQIKCQEYRDWTTANSIDCTPNPTLILENAAEPGDFSHHALFGYKTDGERSSENSTYQFASSGSLISDRWILAAAHSAQNRLGAPIVVRLGTNNDEENDPHIDCEIAEIIMYPEYSKRLLYYDIALVRLKEPVKFSKYIRPICLWDSNEMNFTSVQVTELETADDGLRLQNSYFEVQNKSDCEERFRRIRKIPDGIKDHQLCLVGEREWDSCRGASGSPATITLAEDDCVGYVVGIGSFGANCGQGRTTDVHTKIGSFVDWIESIVWT
ncbi:serine protease snake-like [Armigeres subalbatus]|uniref:serine protease snake-like n=1 Tax=Armigeres subalbatus TaxID=124917 RepID=UPI002ED077DC